MLTLTALVAIATDIVAALVLAVVLYYRRHRRRDLMFAFLALNVGVLAVATALGSAQGAGLGLGLGLFGVLSIIRLRSDPISQAEVAYYFCALALGLIAGLAPGEWWLTPVFAALLLTVVYVADHPRWARRVRTMTLTLDVAVRDSSRLEAIVGQAVGGRVTRADVRELDLVRDLTLVDVWFEPHPTPPRSAPHAGTRAFHPVSPVSAAPAASPDQAPAPAQAWARR